MSAGHLLELGGSNRGSDNGLSLVPMGIWRKAHKYGRLLAIVRRKSVKPEAAE